MKHGIKYLVAGLVATGLAVSSSYAAISVAFNAQGSSYVTDNTGSLDYLTGGTVEIGMFTSGPTVGSSSLANFVEFGGPTAIAPTTAGAYIGAAAATSAGAFSHTQIYLVVLNAGATQEAIVDVNDAIDPTWKFPADADIPNNTAFDLDSLFSGVTGNLATGGQIIYGSKGVDASGPYNMLETQLIPEPSTYILVGTGLLGLLGLRRRS